MHPRRNVRSSVLYVTSSRDSFVGCAPDHRQLTFAGSVRWFIRRQSPLVVVHCCVGQTPLREGAELLLTSPEGRVGCAGVEELVLVHVAKLALVKTTRTLSRSFVI